MYSHTYTILVKFGAPVYVYFIHISKPLWFCSGVLCVYVLYPLIVRLFHSQNGKHEISTESQPINFVWYRQCTFVLDILFSDVYQFGASRMIFHHILTSYI